MSISRSKTQTDFFRRRGRRVQNESSEDDGGHRALTPQAVLNNLLINPVEAELTETETKEILFLAKGQLSLLSGNYDQSNPINAALDKVDVGAHTFLRLWMVFEYVLLNGDGSDRDNPDSTFNQHVVGHSEIALLSFVIPITIALLIYASQERRARYMRSMDYPVHRIQRSTRAKEAEISRAEINNNLEIIQDLLDRNKLEPTIQWKDPEKQDPSRASDDSFQTPPSIMDKAIYPLWNTFKKYVKPVWDYLVQSALFFWPAWMIAAIIVGFTASFALPVLPIADDG